MRNNEVPKKVKRHLKVLRQKVVNSIPVENNVEEGKWDTDFYR